MTDATQKTTESRRERRVSIQSAQLPFLGSRNPDFVPFQYLIQDVSRSGVRIALPRWVVKREALFLDDEVNFHLPFLMDRRILNRGKVAWVKWDAGLDAQVLGVRMDAGSPAYYPVYVSFDSDAIDIDLADFETESDLLAQVMKDSLLLKRGILVYLKHLAPIIPRITDFPMHEYGDLCAFMCQDVKIKVADNVAALTRVLAEIEGRVCAMEELYACIDLEKLRACMEPEIYVDVWKNTFRSKTVDSYLDAVKQLEQRLYSNYNTVVLLYLRGLAA